MHYSVSCWLHKLCEAHAELVKDKCPSCPQFRKNLTLEGLLNKVPHGDMHWKARGMLIHGFICI